MAAHTPEETESLGLHVDMLDVDRLREWARLLLVYGPDIGNWGSVPFVVAKMQTLATDIEKTVRDVGALREQRAELLSALKDAIETIRTWHSISDGANSDVMWALYQQSPEMQRYRAAIVKAESGE